MEIAQSVLFICWIIFLGYWVVSARSVKQTEEEVGGIGGYWHWILIAIGFLAMETSSVFTFDIYLLPNLFSSVIIQILSIICSILGLTIAILARKELAENWSGSVTFKKNHELITKGVYHYMRHPIYTGVLLMIIASGLLIGTIGAVVGFVIIFLTFWFKFKQEEELMTKHFSKEYPHYKKKVKALIPYLF